MGVNVTQLFPELVGVTLEDEEDNVDDVSSDSNCNRNAEMDTSTMDTATNTTTTTTQLRPNGNEAQQSNNAGPGGGLKKARSLEDVCRGARSLDVGSQPSHEMEFMSSRIQKLKVQD